MSIKNSYIIFLLFITLLCCTSTVSAVSNDTIDNVVSEADSSDEFVSVRVDDQVEYMDESVLSAQEEYDNLTVNNDEEVLSQNHDNSYLSVTSSETNNYLNDIKASTSDEYFKFVNYLINQKGFKFNTKNSDDGYTIYSNSNYQSKLYDGENYIFSAGTSYFLSKNRAGYVIDEYYPDILYYQNNNIYVDELYLGWLKNVEKYHPTLNVGGTSASVAVSVSQSSSQSSSSNLPTVFDLRNVNGNNYLTPVKDQAGGGTCWAFASIAALESFLLKTEGKTYDFSAKYDFSENNLKNVMSNLGRQGIDFIKVNGGGFSNNALAYFLRWSGPISEELDKYMVDSYNNPINNNPLEFNNSEKHVQGVKYIHARDNFKDNDEIKQAIRDYGGVVTSMWMVQNYPYLSGSNYYYFGNMDEVDNQMNRINYGHEICIVGWNDNYSKENFGINAPDDGAFIVKNSWGSNWGDNGYFYMSYYDNGLGFIKEHELNHAIGFVFTSVQDKFNYDLNHHYNPLGTTIWMKTDVKTLKYYNKYIASSNEILKACGVYVDGNITCDINVFVNENDKVIEQKSIPLKYAGFHTITFDNPAKISKGQNFKIEITLHSNHNILLPVECSVKYINSDEVRYTGSSSNPGESFFNLYGDWSDITSVCRDANLCLNVYADYDAPVPTRIDASDLTMNDGEIKYITVTLYDIKDNKLKNIGMTICSNGVTVMGTTDGNGQISLPWSMAVGTYKVNISFSGNDRYKNSTKSITVIVNQIIIQATTSSGPTVDLPLSPTSGALILPSQPINTPQPLKNIKIKSGIKNGATYAYKQTLTLHLTVKTTLTVTVKGNSKSSQVKFKNGEGNLYLSKHNLGKGVSRKFTFSGSNSAYNLNQPAITIKTKK